MVIGPPQGSQQQGWQIVPSQWRIPGKRIHTRRKQSFWYYHAMCASKCLTNGYPERKSLNCSNGKFLWCKHSSLSISGFWPEQGGVRRKCAKLTLASW